MENKKQNIESLINKVIGYTLLSPAIVSVVLFFLQLTGVKDNTLLAFHSSPWTGFIDYYETSEKGSGGGGYTSALPLYFGLMAIAGVFLLTKKNN
jgi:hypothetical protein